MFLSNIKSVFILLLILSLFSTQFKAQEDSDEDVDEEVDSDGSDSDSDDSADSSGGTDGNEERNGDRDSQESTTTELITTSTTTTTDKTKTAKSKTKVTENTDKDITSSTIKPMTTTTATQMTIKTTLKTEIKTKSEKQESDDMNEDNEDINDNKSDEKDIKDNKTKENKDIEREDDINDDDNEDYEEEEGKGGNGDDDYFEEMTSEDMLKSLIQRGFAANDLNISDVRNRSADQKWIEFVTQVDNGLQSLVRAITPTALDAFYTMPDLSPSCANSLLRITTGLQQTQEWAYKLIDSNGKFPTGLMSGTLSSLGAYDQCLETVATDDGQELFRGQYCILKLRPPLPPLKGRVNYHKSYISLKGSKYANTWIDRRIAGQYATGFYSSYIYNGLCLPSTCAQHELNAIIKSVVGDLFEVSVDYCDQRSDNKNLNTIISRLNVSQRIALIIIFISIILVFIGTCVEYFGPGFVKTHSFGRLIGCFSVINNLKKLFHINRENSDKSLQFVHGLRVMTMIWIIMIHTFTVGTLFVPMLVYRFEDEARKYGKLLSTQFIFNGYISVSNFFFLSGLIASYITVPIMTQTGGPTFFKYISMRWFRFIPSVIGVICFHIVWPLLGSGPVFKGYAEQLTEPCVSNWWTNILFINNWLLLPDMCLVHTWFLSADFQLHMISFFALLALSRAKGFGLILSIILILSGIAIPALVTHQVNGPPIPMPFEEPDLDQFYRDLNSQYHPTYNHLSTYFVGVLVGYLLIQKRNFKLGFVSKLFLWTVLPALTLAMTFATYLWTGLELPYSRVTASVYNGLHRFLYILFYVWIAIFCSTNHKSLITRFLSSKLFIPLSRLSFAMYLTHILIVWYFVLETRELIRFTHVDFVYSTGGVILYSIFISLLLHLLFESVWSNVLNLIFKKKPKTVEKINENQMKFNESVNTLKNGNHLSYNKNNGKNGVNKWTVNGHKDRNGNTVEEYNVIQMTDNVYIDVGQGGQPTPTHFNVENYARNTKL